MNKNKHTQHTQLAFAKTLKKIRHQSNLKREYLASELKVSLSKIDKMEQGNVSIKLSDVHLICQAMKIQMCDFLSCYEEEYNKYVRRHPTQGKGL